MKLCKRIAPVLLAMMMLLSTTAFAAGSIDLDRDVNLTISYQDGSTPLVDAAFNIYLVASVDETGELTTTDDFQQFHVDIRGRNDAAWKTLASTLEGYVLRDNITPTDSGKTDASGYLRFPTGGKKQTPGLYLVLGRRHTQGGFRYDPMPFMVMLPTQDTEKNVWRYDVLVNPKFDSSEIPDTPSTITRKVLKVWDDAKDKDSRPTEVAVQLLRDGKVYDTKTLSTKNNWRYTWSGLDDRYTWSVVEKKLQRLYGSDRTGGHHLCDHQYAFQRNTGHPFPDRPEAAADWSALVAGTTFADGRTAIPDHRCGLSQEKGA